jgi:chemosensory pili system protein ChpA (sensor histidine kinase/response regulator)
VADTLSVAAEMPPLAAFDETAAVVEPSHDPALPVIDASREVYWTTEPTPTAPLPELAESEQPLVFEPIPDYDVATSADLRPEAIYTDTGPAQFEPVSVPAEAVALALDAFDQPASTLEVPSAASSHNLTSEWSTAAPSWSNGPSAAAPSPHDVELTDIFSAEAAELLEQLDAALEAWRNGDDGEPVLDIQRALHTLKGGARMAGLETMGDVAHEFETQVNRVVASGDYPDAATFSTLTAQLESLQTLHDRLRRGEAAILPAASVLDVPAEPTIPAPVATSEWLPELFWRPEDLIGGLSQQRRETARVPVDALDTMLNEAGEISIYRSRLEEHNAGLRVQLGEMTQTIVRVREQLRMMEFETEAQIAARGLSSTVGDGGSDRYAHDFDPLEMDRFSRMQELSRALAESINDLSSLQATMEQVVGDAETLLQQQSRINTEVQQGLMGTLMVPFSRQLQRLARVVRQTAQENGKQAEVQFAGAEAELDRNVLERMTAPLEHLLRNAVVHGIESPQQRALAGKPETGQITVQLWREGSQLLVEVGDDGGGLDFIGIRDKAVERGLMAPDAQASDDDLSRFIFEPGFSTAQRLTQDAGRGIGMDVVSSEVKQLGGTLELRSEIGRGTRFLVRLPLTLAVSQALLVSVGGESYAVPLASVEGIARIVRRELDDYFRADGPLFAYGGRGYRVSYLGDYLGLQSQPPEGDSRTLTAILVRVGEGLSATSERRVALIVDRMLGNRDVVSKAAGPQLSAVPGVAGATILADGRVVLILDVPALVAARARHALMADAGGRAPLAQAASVDVRELVMVVDDSVTMRRVAERLLSRNGYRVITARDGLDAMAMLQTETPSTLLLDIEMPRADGFEVAAFVRNTPRLAQTPIIMITSRSGEKHRERARSLRVDRYLIKPYQEEQLLGEINAVRRSRST